jgi:excisionase family DNA binding protein
VSATRRPLALTISEAAQALNCSEKHIRRLIAEAESNRRSRWRWGRELIDLAPVGSTRRMIRINAQAVVPPLSTS